MKNNKIRIGVLAVLLAGVSSAYAAPPDARPPVLVAAVSPARGADLELLQRLVRTALERSPGTREAEANWRASVHDIEEARAGLWPKVEVSANTASAKLDHQSAPGLRGGVGAVASYTLIDFGKTRKQVNAREHQAASLQSQVLLTREATTYEVVAAYLQLVKYQRMLRIYERHVDELNDLIGKLKEIVAVFVGRSSELTQARTRLGHAKDAINTLRARQRESQLALMRLVGPSARDLVPDERLPDFGDETVAGVLAQASRSHPAVAAARSEADAALSLAEEAAAAREPQVELQLAKQGGKDAMGRSYPVQLYMSAKWAAFQGFGDRAAEQALRERAQAARERMAQLLIELEFNIHSARADFDAQAGRLSELRDLVAGTDQVRQDYFIQWRDLGRRSLLDVLTAESEHLNARLSLAGSEVDQVLAAARIRYEGGSLKEWLVGDEGRAVAIGEPAPTVVTSADHRVHEGRRLSEPAPMLAPGSLQALAEDEPALDEPRLAHVGATRGSAW